MEMAFVSQEDGDCLVEVGRSRAGGEPTGYEAGESVHSYHWL